MDISVLGLHVDGTNVEEKIILTLNQKQKKSMNPKNMVTILSGIWTCRISLTVLLNLIAKARGLKTDLRNKVSDQVKLAPTAFSDL